MGNNFSGQRPLLENPIREDSAPLGAPPTIPCGPVAGDNSRKKLKRASVVLDHRIELTDEELKVARAQYLHIQKTIRREAGFKLLERHWSKTVGDMVWGAPECIRSATLTDFWKQIFKTQADGQIFETIAEQEKPLRKRPRYASERITSEVERGRQAPCDTGAFFGHDTTQAVNLESPQNFDRLRSSEEPGQGRHRPEVPSFFEDVNGGLEHGITSDASQRTSLFPWDGAAGSSTSGGAYSGTASMHPVELSLRASPWNSKDSSPMITSQILFQHRGSKVSPISRQDSSMILDSHESRVNIQDQAQAIESQLTDQNLLGLEKMSSNFFEYLKMQTYSLPSPQTSITFADIIPPSASTRHVAASAFYHCLVLATKDSLRLTQTDRSHSIIISIVNQ